MEGDKTIVIAQDSHQYQQVMDIGNDVRSECCLRQAFKLSDWQVARVRRPNDVGIWHLDSYARIGGLEVGADVIGSSKMGCGA